MNGKSLSFVLSVLLVIAVCGWGKPATASPSGGVTVTAKALTAEEEATNQLTPDGELDSDNDEVADTVDNCPWEANSDQWDVDGDGIGDVCDVPQNRIETEGDSDEDEASLRNWLVDVTVIGLDDREPAALEMDDSGKFTVIIGDASNPTDVLVVDGAGAGAEVELDLVDDTTRDVTVARTGGVNLLLLHVAGLEVGGEVEIKIARDGKQTITLTDDSDVDVATVEIAGADTEVIALLTLGESGDLTASVTNSRGSAVSMVVQTGPAQSYVVVGWDEQGRAYGKIADQEGVISSVSLAAASDRPVVGYSIIYNEPLDETEAARIVPGLMGLADRLSYSGSITLAGSGLDEVSSLTVTVGYDDGDLSAVDEESLRLFIYDEPSRVYVEAGANDAGVGLPTGVANDYGVNAVGNYTWAESTRLGKFAVGAPREPLALTLEESPSPTCGVGIGPCGIMGGASWTLMLAGLGGMRRHCRRRMG